MRLVIFCVVLPFAQLVPVFTWLEAFRLPSVDTLLLRMGLAPTAKPGAMVADAGDSLWSFLQAKYRSHAGFLVEAFVEALPQALLQTAFAAVTQTRSTLNVTSIAISVFTIASKGYLVSYALDYITFAFNFACIVADSIGLFAIVTTLVQNGVQGALAHSLVATATIGLCLSVVGGWGVLWFSIFDDHLKMRDPIRWPCGVRGVSNIFFDLYIVRAVAWFLAIVPCIVLFAGARLSLLPIGVLRSMDPDLVRHARFFRSIVHFLTGTGGGSADPHLRLASANSLISFARKEADFLERALRYAGADQRARAVSKWVTSLGYPKAVHRRVSVHSAQSRLDDWPTARSEGEDEAMQRAILASLSSRALRDAAAHRSSIARIRHLRAVLWLRQQCRHVRCELERRSAIIHAALQRKSLQMRPLDVVIQSSGILALIIVAICVLPLLVGHVILILVSLAFPVLQAAAVCPTQDSTMVTCTSADANETCKADGKVALSCGFSFAYCAILVFVASLAPMVAKRQLLWVDLLDLKDLPEPFYGGAVLVEIRKRHLRDSLLRDRLGYNLCRHVLTFLEDGVARS